MKWIKCSERMPEPSDRSVLCYFTNGSVEPVQMVHVEDWARGLMDDRMTITYWMEMPEPPTD